MQEPIHTNSSSPVSSHSSKKILMVALVVIGIAIVIGVLWYMRQQKQSKIPPPLTYEQKQAIITEVVAEIAKTPPMPEAQKTAIIEAAVKEAATTPTLTDEQKAAIIKQMMQQ